MAFKDFLSGFLHKKEPQKDENVIDLKQNTPEDTSETKTPENLANSEQNISQSSETQTPEKLADLEQNVSQEEPETQTPENSKRSELEIQASDGAQDTENEADTAGGAEAESTPPEFVKETDTVQAPAGAEEPGKEPSFFERLKAGLKKTGENISKKLDLVLTANVKIDDDMYEELEEILVTSDISFDTTVKIIENLKDSINKKNIKDSSLVKDELKNVLFDILSDNDASLCEDSDKAVILVVGVNGVGKTTTIGKMAQNFKSNGKSVLLAAGDTFRAAAAEQLEIWADRAKVPIVTKQEGSDPSSVIYDAAVRAKKEHIDLLICDSAGRLHNKKNLMNELGKMIRVIKKEYPEAKLETLLVIDAATGQNALSQVRAFSEIVPLTGIIMTKLDGTAKGGVLFSIKNEFDIPIKYIGVGEKAGDLQVFDPRSFVQALFE